MVPSNKPRDVQGHRKSHTSSQPFVFNILKALEPPNTEVHPYTDRFEDGYLTVEMPTRDPRDHSEKRERKGSGVGNGQRTMREIEGEIFREEGTRAPRNWPR